MARRRNNPSDSRRYTDWISAAYDDLRVARLIWEDETLFNMAAFHCQQCAEKSLKGFILFKTAQTVDGHNLTWLCRRATGIEPRFSQWLDESAALNRYYIETRYPTDIPTEIQKDEMERISRMTEELFGFIAGELGLLDRLDELEAY